MSESRKWLPACSFLRTFHVLLVLRTRAEVCRISRYLFTDNFKYSCSWTRQLLRWAPLCYEPTANFTCRTLQQGTLTANKTFCYQFAIVFYIMNILIPFWWWKCGKIGIYLTANPSLYIVSYRCNTFDTEITHMPSNFLFTLSYEWMCWTQLFTLPWVWFYIS